MIQDIQEQKQGLPIGLFSFELLRSRGKIYVDKTGQLMNLADTVERCFISRPRRFGKSLMLSTLEAMFTGRTELFKGLAAENWVAEQAKHPTTVLRFDMSTLDSSSAEMLEQELILRVQRIARNMGVVLPEGFGLKTTFEELIIGLYEKFGSLAVLIDEYDAPILSCITEPEKAEAVREVLHSFYIILKASDQYLRFVMLTGISKFSQVGVFSGMNNLCDISRYSKWGTILGWTQEELETNFAPWLDDFAESKGVTRSEILRQMKEYYDGFCFDGEHRVYNPWSVLMCLEEQSLGEYWFESATPTALVYFLKKFGMNDPNYYDGLVVDETFTSARTIERAEPESFLYQTGYLTIKKRENGRWTLGYPNREVKFALSRTYLHSIYGVKNYISISDKLWLSLNTGDINSAIQLYNEALMSLSYNIFAGSNTRESLYQGLFMMLLNAAGIMALGEIPNSIGRADVVVVLKERVYVIEFKLSENANGLQKKLAEAMTQIKNKHYEAQYLDKAQTVTAVAVAVDNEKRQAVFSSENIK